MAFERYVRGINTCSLPLHVDHDPRNLLCLLLYYRLQRASDWLLSNVKQSLFFVPVMQQIKPTILLIQLILLIQNQFDSLCLPCGHKGVYISRVDLMNRTMSISDRRWYL